MVTNFAKVPTPDGVAFNGEGNLFVTSPFTDSIWVVTRDGVAHTLSFDTTRAKLNDPSNLAFRGVKLYITNLAATGSSTISVVTVEDSGQDG